MSPVSRGRKPKKSSKSSKSRQQKNQATPGSPRAFAADLGAYSFSPGSSSPLDSLLMSPRASDTFGPSLRRVLDASGVLTAATGPRELEQATAALIGAELRNPELHGMRFDLWGSDLVDSARDRVLSDVTAKNDTWPGPWWLLHGLAAIGSLGLGGYAWQQSAVAANSLPRDLLARQPEWLALLPDIAATGDAHMLRDAYGTRFAVVAAFEYPGGPRTHHAERPGLAV